MAIDWDKFQADVDDAIAQAGKRTDAKLAGKVSSITRLTDEEIEKLFPEPADVKKLAELMEIVKNAGDRNQKINQIVSNIESFGGIVFTLLQKFA
jgi:hypothetical protein